MQIWSADTSGFAAGAGGSPASQREDSSLATLAVQQSARQLLVSLKCLLLAISLASWEDGAGPVPAGREVDCL